VGIDAALMLGELMLSIVPSHAQSWHPELTEAIASGRPDSLQAQVLPGAAEPGWTRSSTE